MNQPAHTWITRPPFVRLPVVMVTMALFGHILVFRRLRSVAAERPVG